MGQDAQIGAGVPVGSIILWSGLIANIPAGWALCNGAGGTPDLRNKFIVCADADAGGVAKTTLKGGALQSGGVHEHTLIINEMPDHNHNQQADTMLHRPGTGSNQYESVGSGRFDKGETTGGKGGGLAHENCPPFFALAYIMKT